MSNVHDTSDFETALVRMFQQRTAAGDTALIVVAGELHGKVGGYPGPDHRMPSCCGAMRSLMRPGRGDRVVHAPPKEKRGLILRAVCSAAGGVKQKVAVWKRDGGKCVQCGSASNLHFDHDLPYSKGGSSITVDNVKILCARHNLGKGAKIISLGPLLGPLVFGAVASMARGA
jgi:hypothetical protein